MKAQDFAFSIVAHALVVLGLLFLKQPRDPQQGVMQVPIEVIEATTAVPAVTSQPVLPPPPPQAPPKISEAPQVFGVSNDSLFSGDQTGEVVKRGNTVAKEVDDIQSDGQGGQLPIPVAGYLVSQMPRLKTEIRIPYPDRPRTLRIQGPVVLSLLIDANGKVRDAQVISTPHPDLGEAALAAIRQFLFEPAYQGATPVVARIRYTYRFILEN